MVVTCRIPPGTAELKVIRSEGLGTIAEGVRIVGKLTIGRIGTYSIRVSSERRGRIRKQAAGIKENIPGF